MKITVTPGRKIMGRLAKGEDLLAALTNCAREHGITLGEVQAIGAVSQARVGFYNQEERKYHYLDLDAPREIAALTGNISLKGRRTHGPCPRYPDRKTTARLWAGIWPRAPWSLPANSPSRNTGPPRPWCGKWTIPPGCSCGPRSKGVPGKAGLVQWCMNAGTHCLLRENHFPLTLALSPIGGEGKRYDRSDTLPSLKTRPPNLLPLPPLQGGRYMT